VAKKKRKLDHGSKRSSRSSSPTVESTEKLKGSFLSGREGIILFSLVVLAFLIYSNILKSPFIFDDFNNIRHNPHIRLTKLTLEGVTRAGLESYSSNRPIANISFALNYYFHQDNVLGYHLVNILIHAAAGFFLYLLVKTTLNLPSLRSRYGSYEWIPLFTVLIWLVHPIQTQSVTYIVQRMNSMAAMFYVLSLLLYAKARLCPAGENKKKWSLFAGCVLSGLLAIGSKEIAATLPFFIFLYEWYFFQDLNLPWLKRHLLPVAALLVFLSLSVLMYIGTHPLEYIYGGYQARDFTLVQRVLTEFRVVIFYISLLVFPHSSRLNLDHDFTLSYSLIDPITTLLCLGFIAGLVVLAIFIAKRERLFSFCIFWFLGNLLIESSVIGLEIIFEHRLYMPSMMVSMLMVLLVYRHVKLEWVRVTVLSAALILLAFWTYERNSVWADDVKFWLDCAAKSPKKARPHNNLAVIIADRGNINEAIAYFDKALQIKPEYAEAHNNKGLALARQGKLEEAVGHFSESLQIKPNYADAHSNLGNALARQGRLEEAIRHCSEALRIRPDFAKAHNNLGIALAKQGKHGKAMNHYFEALRIKPDYADAHNNLGLALARQGKLDAALSHYIEALRIIPDYAKAHNNLGNALASQGKLGEAVVHYSRVLRIEPDFVEAHNNLGVALASQGKFEEAMGHFSAALRIKPDYADARWNLEHALQLTGKSPGAANAVAKP